MGDRLWTSPATGYRRIGTRVSEIRALFETSITVRSICEPLKACFAHEKATETAHLLRDRGFDVAGVKDDDSETIKRFVRASALRKAGTVGDYGEDISLENLISDATPLAQIFSVLGNRSYSFVLGGGSVSGIVTRADLNKPPARIYLFALVSLLEMHLLFWIREEFGDTWSERLKQNRIDDAKKLFEKRRQKGQELDLCECLQICDKATLVISSARLRELLGIESKNAGAKIFRRVQDLRDLLAHGQTNLVEGSSWEELSIIVRWIERALEKSDAEIERMAVSSGTNYVERFWSATR
jgi:hypothetical protein